MGRPFLAAALVVGMVLLDLSAAAAEPRVALVIGNGAYRDTPLANPTNDARLIAKTLSDLGFELIVRADVEQKAMKLAIIEFGDRLEAAGKDAVGLFYYAGHGVRVRGRNSTKFEDPTGKGRRGGSGKCRLGARTDGVRG